MPKAGFLMTRLIVSFLMKSLLYNFLNLRSSLNNVCTVLLFCLNHLGTFLYIKEIKATVMILNFRTDKSGQTVQNQIRLLLEEQSDQGLHCLLFHLHHLTKYPKVWPLCLNFRQITVKFSGVRKFRNFTVICLNFRMITAVLGVQIFRIFMVENMFSVFATGRTQTRLYG